MKTYIALLSQHGESSPEAIVLENTLDGEPVLSRNAAGNYFATLEGAFPFDKTVIFIRAFGDASVPNLAAAIVNDVDKIIITTTQDISSGENTDDVLDRTAIEIRVYEDE